MVNTDIYRECFSHTVKPFKVEGLFLLCTIDIVKEVNYIQVLKVWDLVPLEGVTKLVRRHDNIFKTYNHDFITRCNGKCFEV